jgi:hypothetical protein
VSRAGGDRDHDVFDDDRDVGRIFLDANRTWFRGVSFQSIGRKGSSRAATLEETKAVFRTAYLA